MNSKPALQASRPVPDSQDAVFPPSSDLPERSVYRPDPGFKSIISPTNLLQRPDIIPYSSSVSHGSASPRHPGFEQISVQSDISGGQLEAMFQDVSRKSRVIEDMKEQIAQANALNDKYYARIQTLEQTVKVMEELKCELESLKAELKTAQEELKLEREFKYGDKFVEQFKNDLAQQRAQEVERRSQGIEREVAEQRLEIQRLLELTDAFSKKEATLQHEIGRLEAALKTEQTDNVSLSGKYKELEEAYAQFLAKDKEEYTHILELQSNLEEVTHHNSQLTKMLKEQQDLNQLLSLKLRETEDIHSENSLLRQNLQTIETGFAEVKGKYEKQLADYYQLQLKLRSIKEPELKQRRPKPHHSVSEDFAFTNTHAGKKNAKTHPSRATTVSMAVYEENSEESEDELSKMVEARKAELGFPEEIIQDRKPPHKTGKSPGSASCNHCVRHGCQGT